MGHVIVNGVAGIVTVQEIKRMDFVIEYCWCL